MRSALQNGEFTEFKESFLGKYNERKG